VFLKRLTMKGFKSFADTTDLEFEPGVTAVVGPNGSGKSNVVDAVTWVLGAQSTRALRSARMDDVIFMGTTTRPALGRAEVSLTIDNTSGKLPIDGAEVTISRTLFRNGDSEYAINGTTCRLLDVQELLGDSGVGRQQHMIIGQGQLDAILTSSSENRRAVIEEAAGVLKHRRRKERAERRLDATQENLQRLGDLVREVRRQMRPLERQAASARHHADVEAELRAARHALFAERLASFEARRLSLEHDLAAATTRERTLRDEVITLDAQAATAAADLASRREELLASALGTLQALAERARGTSSLIAERVRSLRAALVASADENVTATLEADAARVGADLIALEREEAELGSELAALEAARAELAGAVAAFEEQWASAGEDVEGALAARRERVVLLERSLASLREAERRAVARLDDARALGASARERRALIAGEAQRASAQLEATRAERASADADATGAEVDAARADAAWREAADHAARTQARAEALARALDELSGAGGRAVLTGLDGVLGSFLDLVEVDEGAERAVEAAVGAAAGAMVVDGRVQTRAALEALRREGGAGLILPVAETPVSASDAPAGTAALRTMVRARRGAPAHVTRVLDALFSRAVVADGFDAGIEVAVAHPDLVVVTRDGDRFAASGWRVASGRALVTRATVDDALSAADAAVAAVTPLRERAERAARAVRVARERVARASGAEATAVADVERLASEDARWSADAAEAAASAERLAGEVAELSGQCATLADELEVLRAAVAGLEAALSGVEERRVGARRASGELDAMRASVAERGAAWSRREAQVAERRRLLERRRVEIEQRLEGRHVERDEAARRRESLEFDLAALGRLEDLVARAAEDIRLSQGAMDSSYREQLEASRAGAERLEEIRRARRATEERLGEVAEATRRHEIAHAELAVMVANLHDVVRRDLGVEPADLGEPVALEVPGGLSLDQHVAELEARITSLGPINPWALEELAELEERYRDLDAQVGDVRHARRELQEAIRALDDQIMTTFAEAYVDVNEHFSHLIGMLFPGGQGRLTLTEPDDPLNTGVEIEVRPMGRNIRRISLLSGGERSMVTLAFLFAVFRSRPSPFYMMDEVEAALDDVNLQRFLSLVDEFRHEAQLLIVTHQKRTMESADALYGVTMVPGGSSKVVSQRVNRPSEVPA
jgi:chromosome segregation protein